MQCTSPFTEPGDIRACIAACATGESDSAFCASRFHGKLWRGGGGRADPVNHDGQAREPRQLAAFAEFIEAGSVYCVEALAFAKQLSRFAGRTAIVEVPARRTLEIDEPWQLERAREIATGG
jgi:CMP-N-acetylneuraminic acid synthetase